MTGKAYFKNGEELFSKQIVIISHRLMGCMAFDTFLDGSKHSQRTEQIRNSIIHQIDHNLSKCVWSVPIHQNGEFVLLLFCSVSSLKNRQRQWLDMFTTLALNWLWLDDRFSLPANKWMPLQNFFTLVCSPWNNSPLDKISR